MFQYDFMLNAFAAAGIVSVLAGLIGYFVVLRGQTFAAHALAHVGFAGATGAVLIGVPPLGGMIGLSVIAGAGMGALGERLERRDVAIGLLLSFSLGLGLLFLHFYTAYAAELAALLFGNVLGVDRPTIVALAATGAAAIAMLGAMARPLLFASLQPEVAEARGVPLRLVSVLFLAILALAVAQAAQIVGVLLVFALTVAPAATAQRVTTRLGLGIALSVAFALAASWLGITLAFYTDWPTTFWIATLGTAGYLLTLALEQYRSSLRIALWAAPTRELAHSETEREHP